MGGQVFALSLIAVFPPGIFGHITKFLRHWVSNIDHIIASRYQIAVNWRERRAFRQPLIDRLPSNLVACPIVSCSADAFLDRNRHLLDDLRPKAIK
jgi:hypothetical protein